VCPPQGLSGGSEISRTHTLKQALKLLAREARGRTRVKSIFSALPSLRTESGGKRINVNSHNQP
jgi:hypothetical protein